MNFFSDTNQEQPCSESKLSQNTEQTCLTSRLKSHIRTIKDWPQPGIQFRDITPLLGNAIAFKEAIAVFAARYQNVDIQFVAGVEARGFILGPALALALNAGFIPIRKKGKLPFNKLTQEYALEYGQATIEIHTDACLAGDKVLIIDDLIATGGTMLAGIKLLEKLGANVVEAAAIINLYDLDGAKKIHDAGVSTFTLCEFSAY